MRGRPVAVLLSQRGERRGPSARPHRLGRVPRTGTAMAASAGAIHNRLAVTRRWWITCDQDLQTGEIAYFRFPCGSVLLTPCRRSPRETATDAGFDDKDGSSGEDSGRPLACPFRSRRSMAWVVWTNTITSSLRACGPQPTAIWREDAAGRIAAFGAIWSDKIHQQDGSSSRKKGTRDFLRVQDMLTAEVAHFGGRAVELSSTARVWTI